MPYSPAYNDVTMSSDELATSTKQNQQNDNIKHNNKYKPQTGPDTPATGLKIARGIIYIPFSSSTLETKTVVFATDCDDGDPGFNNLPTVVVSFFSATGIVKNIGIETITKDDFKVLMKTEAPVSGNMVFSFIAMGD